LEIAAQLADFCAARSIPFGFNIESVAIKNDEIEASIFIVNKISEMLNEMGVRKTKKPGSPVSLKLACD
jgi:hypothetical protein